MEAALLVLRKHWGYSDFRPGQKQVVEALFAGRDVLALLPTGGGKSICYQVPGMVFGGLTLVVSPLIALMRDQVEGLQRRGIPATAIDSTLPTHLREAALKAAREGQLRFLYAAPERLVLPSFLEELRSLPITLVAIDEAHCISQWGHDFRTSYTRLKELRAYLPQSTPWIALTATATPRVRRDIITYLDLRNPAQIQQSFHRKNFYYAVVHTLDKDTRLLQTVHKLQGSGIIYVSSRSRSRQLAQKLRQYGFSAEGYHAGMPSSQRSYVQDRWIRGEVRLIVATSAFGMGIDKPDTRFVVHYDPAWEPEAYLQEVGRAGRDGELAHAIALFSPKDSEALQLSLHQKYPPHEFLRRLYASLQQTSHGIATLTMEGIAKAVKESPSVVRRALHLLGQEELLSWRESREGQSARGVIRSLVPPESWQRNSYPLAQWILRLGGDALFQEGAYVDFGDWAYQLQLPYSELYQGLEQLRKKGWIAHEAMPLGAVQVRLPTPPPSPTAWEALRHKYQILRNQAQARARFMLGYYQERTTCRAQYLLRYFEEAVQPCGQCDVCKGYYRPAQPTSDERAAARAWLSELAAVPRPMHDIRKALQKAFPKTAETLLEELLSEGRLEVVQGAYLRWKK